MKFTVMDKTVILVLAMILAVQIWFAVEIMMGVESPEKQAWGLVVLLFVDAYITTSYLKHRHEYRSKNE